MVRDDQLDAREGWARRREVAERFVVPLKPGNAGGGKGPEFKVSVRRCMRAWRVAMSLLPPIRVQKHRAAFRVETALQSPT